MLSDHRLQASQLIRDWLEKEIKDINSTHLPAKSKEKILEEKSKVALFRLGHIWIGDLKFK